MVGGAVFLILALFVFRFWRTSPTPHMEAVSA
jgi:hypothetical protein